MTSRKRSGALSTLGLTSLTLGLDSSDVLPPLKSSRQTPGQVAC